MTTQIDNSRTGENIECRYIHADQYADGKAAQVWDLYIGCKHQRTSQYKDWLCKLLRDYNCEHVLDVACGTGVDSMMLLDEGFKVTSTDGSDKMLKYALRDRWERRKETHFDSWVIEEANWLTLVDDTATLDTPEEGFDAVLCLGNSFAHLSDERGNQQDQRVALTNFKRMIKPGGLLVIDHRNYDAILDKGRAPAKNIYYNSDHIRSIECCNVYVNGKARSVTLDYDIDISKAWNNQSLVKKHPNTVDMVDNIQLSQKFRLSYYPHRLNGFNSLLEGVFGLDVEHGVYGDFKPADEEDEPAYYIHVVQKAT